ncbi:ADP-ribosylation/Crystallin J1 [Xylariaceae sp. FL0255]|nr:ADP-ribosylation/Crystallin J1 [Xylariaceae sp. FL0255]
MYAGVLGKLIGVYLGRPFEGWTHQRIIQELGHIHYYVNEKLDVPVVVTDDDISGTFTFIRALEEHGLKHGRLPQAIGKTWLNNVIYDQTVFFWGGRGIMTEHTAYVNLKNGIDAPLSGAIQINGRTLAEQVGAQIYIDAWAMMAPGAPELAADLAEASASVSHDGEAVNAGRVWASMESAAFTSSDVGYLLDVGLRAIPSQSLIATVIKDVQKWCAEDGDWLVTRQRIENVYGYDKFLGICHVVPNHAIMIMALIYGGHSFDEAMHIICTSGWDTDSNAGNVGCLVAIMHGLDAFESDTDWRWAVADRALISSADGGYSINNATRLAYDIFNMGNRLRGEETIVAPKAGAQFHFSLPGGVQGFQASKLKSSDSVCVTVEQGSDHTGATGLAIVIIFGKLTSPIEVTTPISFPKEAQSMPLYDLAASPLLYPGQTVKAKLRVSPLDSIEVEVRIMIRVFSFDDQLEKLLSHSIRLAPGGEGAIEWTIPSDLGGRPIESIGLSLSYARQYLFNDTIIWLESLGWSGCPRLTLKEDGSEGDLYYYKKAFVKSADSFRIFQKYWVAHDQGEGMVTYGTKEWANYKVMFEGLTVNMGSPAGVAFRIRGLNRYYALVFTDGGLLQLVKAHDEQRIVLAGATFDWHVDELYTVVIEADGRTLRGGVNGITLSADESDYATGGVGMVVTNGSLYVRSIKIGPLKDAQGGSAYR